MKRFLNWVWSIFEVIIIVYVITITCFILCRNDHGFTQFGEYTFDNVSLTDERNIHDTKKGDLLIIKNSNDINVGDSIFYYATLDKHYIVVEDKVTNKDGNNREAVYNFENNKSIVTSDQIIGKLDKVYSGKAKVYNVLTSRWGFLLLVILPVLLIFIYQIYGFVMLLKEDKELTKQEASPIKLKPRVKE